MSKNLVVILGDQLSQNISSMDNFDIKTDTVLMMEVTNEIEYVNHHKKKTGTDFFCDATFCK